MVFGLSSPVCDRSDHAFTPSFLRILLITLEFNTSVGQLIGSRILSPGNMANRPAVKVGEQLAHFCKQGTQVLVFDLVTPLDLADNQFGIKGDGQFCAALLQSLFQTEKQRLVLGDVIGADSQVGGHSRCFSAVVVQENGSGSGLSRVTFRCSVGEQSAMLATAVAGIRCCCRDGGGRRCGCRLFCRSGEKVTNVRGFMRREKLIEQMVLKLIGQGLQYLFPGKRIIR